MEGHRVQVRIYLWCVESGRNGLSRVLTADILQAADRQAVGEEKESSRAEGWAFVVSPRPFTHCHSQRFQLAHIAQSTRPFA